MVVPVFFASCTEVRRACTVDTYEIQQIVVHGLPLVSSELKAMQIVEATSIGLSGLVAAPLLISCKLRVLDVVGREQLEATLCLPIQKQFAAGPNRPT